MKMNFVKSSFFLEYDAVILNSAMYVVYKLDYFYLREHAGDGPKAAERSCKNIYLDISVTRNYFIYS